MLVRFDIIWGTVIYIKIAPGIFIPPGNLILDIHNL